MAKKDYYEEVKEALGDDFLFGDVGEVMVEIADRHKSQRDTLRELLKLAVLRIGHLPLCARLRPSEEWSELGQYDFSGCSCDLKIFNTAIAKAEGHS
jgi:hypothetical protein